MSGLNYELGSIRSNITNSSSFDRDFHRRKREARRREFESSDTPTSQRPSTSIDASNDLHDDSTLQGYPLLLCLQLVAHHNVSVFSVGRGRKWNTRESLGHGVTFDVEQADLPVREAVSDLQYYDIVKGRRGGFFTDHTGIKWSFDTVVAYKSLFAQGRRNRENRFSDLLRELRILCHPPLQKHPYIARFIGLAWIREEDMASETVGEEMGVNESREWPILITEKAELGTLGKFVHYRASCMKRISLLAKIRLLSNVLEAISDLHACDIIHGDIKSSNILVYTNATGTAENWTAKVIDFSHSVIHAQGTSATTKRDQLVGTDFYRPPELTRPGATFHGSIADRADVWCWGVLSWEVLLDGSLAITEECMQNLRNNRQVAAFARDRCKAYLESHHRDERNMFLAVLSLLDKALEEDPLLRPTAASLVPRVRSLAQHDWLNNRHQKLFCKVAPLHDIPFFDLMHQYFDLVDMLYVPKQVFEALTTLRASDSATNKAEIDFQLGLCHVIGFGVDRNYDKSVQRFSDAATGGFQKARMHLRRIAAALNIALDPAIERLALTWTNATRDETDLEASSRLLVLRPPHGLVPTTHGRPLMKSDESLATDTAPINYVQLVEATKLGKLKEVAVRVHDCEDVNFQLDAGETVLHYAVLSVDSRIAATILQAGADVLRRTTADCKISIAGSDGYQIPANVSPLALTVLLDRVDLLKIFLQHTVNGHSEAKRNETFIDLLVWGAQYQSIGCIGHLCGQLHSKPGRPFNDLGVNPLSYAVRADFLFRIVLFKPNTDGHTQANIPPVISRQLRVVEMLLKAGFPLAADESTGLNCLHIAAATSDVALLPLLLKYRNDSGPNELEQISPEGFSPLGIAITRGREDVYSILIEAGAEHHNAWPEIRGDALHCCALYPSAESVSIATQILKKHPKAVHVRDRMWRTPLHCAAFREHNEMIELLIKARADLAARDFDSYTPLGAAVSGRSIRAIRQICAALKASQKPLISWTFRDPLFGFGILTYSPLEQLLSPGTVSPAREPEMRLEPENIGRFGCCDHPFSNKSLEVLQVLLDCYEHRSRLTINFFEHMFFPMDSYSGIHFAISMGNIEAVKRILQSGKFCHDYRYLVLFAHNQRLLGASHIADETAREYMLDYLEEYHDRRFKSRLKRRQSSWLFFAWKLYYLCYGNLEQEQWKRASSWLRDNRCLEYRPLVLEFVPWARTRWSLNIVSFSIGWIFMAPMVVYFILIHRVPPTECPRNRRIYAMISFSMANFFLLAPQIFSVLSVLYRRCRAQYHGYDRPLALMQCSFSLFVTAGCCYLCYLLQPEQGMLFSTLAPFEFTPKQQSWISTFGSLSQALEGVLIAVPATELLFVFVTLWSERLLKRLSSGKVDTKLKPKHENDYVTYMPWTRTGYMFG